MKEEEIIKALECCLFDNSECLQCQNKELCKIECDELATKALDLINRQKSEIEKLRQEFETAVIERDIIQAQKDFECKKAVGKFAKELDDYYFSGNGSCRLSYVRKAIDTLLTDWLWR